MFIPRKTPPQENDRWQIGEDEVGLHEGHLIIGARVAREVFGNTLTALLAYYPQRRTLLLARVSDEAFKSMHKAEQGLLKLRNARGDLALSIQAILVDHQIDETDRVLPFEAPEGSRMLLVHL